MGCFWPQIIKTQFIILWEEGEDQMKFRCRTSFYFINHPSTCLSDAEHTYALLKSFAGLWRTSNKYKLCPTKIDRSLPAVCSCVYLPNTYLWDVENLVLDENFQNISPLFRGFFHSLRVPSYFTLPFTPCSKSRTRLYFTAFHKYFPFLYV